MKKNTFAALVCLLAYLLHVAHFPSQAVHLIVHVKCRRHRELHIPPAPASAPEQALPIPQPVPAAEARAKPTNTKASGRTFPPEGW